MSSKSRKIRDDEHHEHMDDIDHVINCPWMYTGSENKVIEITLPIYDIKNQQIVFDTGKINMILAKMFDELILNCFDQSVLKKDLTEINITFNPDNSITIRDDGGMSTQKNKSTGLHTPQMVLGMLKTSGNYSRADDADDDGVGGQNGIGAKLATIFSTYLLMDIVGRDGKHHYKQLIENHMRDIHKPEIEKNTEGLRSHVEITFMPDYELLGMKKLTSFDRKFMIKRCYDIAMSVSERVSVTVNGKKLKENTFDEYAKLYEIAHNIGSFEHTQFGGFEALVGIVNEGTKSKFQCVSLVNGIVTYNHGTHVDAFVESICKDLVEILSKRRELKDLKITPAVIKKYMTVFLNCTMKKPRFNGQAKEQLINEKASLVELMKYKKKFIMNLIDEQGLEEALLADLAKKEINESKKNDGKKSQHIIVEKLLDAKYAGSRKSEQCTIIITEGDSAKQLVEAGISEVGGFEYYGVFPIRGKILNTRVASTSQEANSEIIGNIKKIIGLQTGRKYKSLSELRYGKLMAMSDQDPDGFHIRGLLLNFIDNGWPELIKLGFFEDFTTPLIKLLPKSDTAKKRALKLEPSLEGELWFFSENEYNDFVQTHGTDSGFHKKYFKGLATSDKKDAQKYFRRIKERCRLYDAKDFDAAQNALSLAFDKKRADDRKVWLKKTRMDQEDLLDYGAQTLDVCDFINKELKIFSFEDNIRSIPDIRDGFKPSQRGILYVAKKRIKNTEKKVGNFASTVSDDIDYAHGETSLQQAIISMAQDYPGAGNHNTLLPKGMFGSRTENGKNAGAARYIYTQYNPADNCIHRDEDDPILEYHRHEDGRTREPVTFAPVIPTVLLYGITGIGTGYSTDIPCYKPDDVIFALKQIMEGKTPDELIPWYRGFKGTIEKITDGKYAMKGCYNMYENKGKYYVNITEIPTTISGTSYFNHINNLLIDTKIAQANRKELEKLKEKDKKGKGKSKGRIKTLKNKLDDKASTASGAGKIKTRFVIEFDYSKFQDNAMDFTIQISADKYKQYQGDRTLLEKELKLSANINTTNMHMFVPKGKNLTIKKFDSANDIIREFFNIRVAGYAKRKDYYIDKYADDMEERCEKMKYIKLVIKKKIEYAGRKSEDVEADMESYGLKRLNGKFDHLWSISTRQYTMEAVAKLKAEIAEIQEKYNYYDKHEPKEIWEHDLEKFCQEIK